jgi:hypothetical protein
MLVRPNSTLVGPRLASDSAVAERKLLPGTGHYAVADPRSIRDP